MPGPDLPSLSRQKSLWMMERQFYRPDALNVASTKAIAEGINKARN